MLGVNATTDSYRFNESRMGAEHWVGGSEGFAHPVLSKTHTRTSGQDESRRFWFLANGQRLATNDASPEDDI
jgi:hypothetical protein